MRAAIKKIAGGSDDPAWIDEHPSAACGCALHALKAAFEAWSQPEAESVLSEKEEKGRGCF